MSARELKALRQNSSGSIPLHIRLRPRTRGEVLSQHDLNVDCVINDVSLEELDATEQLPEQPQTMEPGIEVEELMAKLQETECLTETVHEHF